MKVNVSIVHAFTDGERGGNPAGVVLEAERFTALQKQTIAAAVGLSETAFVSPSRVADFKLEFFTPTMQIPHCGHATVATFSHLDRLGMIPSSRTSKETIDGRREILLVDGLAFMEQRPPRYHHLTDTEISEVSVSLGLEPAKLNRNNSAIVNTGNSFLLIELHHTEGLRLLTPDLARVARFSARHDLIGYYLFTRETFVTGRDASTRMFAPRYGIAEEAATGMAAGPLACFLHDHLGADKDCFSIEQGFLMPPPSPSLIKVDLQIENNQIAGLMAGGSSRLSEERLVEF